ncbi:DNA-binding protein [Virgibacillus sp. DJP39]|uniref:DNA-binding protein n=1 Tax=Virgibacillus sp. DJP39 TaxID=3409790 RepID=UPI003BB748BA
MSLAVIKETEKEIDLAYKHLNMPKIQKETSYILGQIFISMLRNFKERLKSISLDYNDDNFNEAFIKSDKNRKALIKWLNQINHMGPLEDYEFGKLKVDFEEWFYQIGGQQIEFEYQDSYLLKPKEAAEALGISTVTLNKYVKQGFEYIDHSSQNRIPKHMIYIWKDPFYSIKIQAFYQKKKILNQTPRERLKDVMDELVDFQMKYQATTVKQAFPSIDGDGMNTLADYYEWQSLEEEYTELKEKMFRDPENDTDF